MKKYKSCKHCKGTGVIKTLRFKIAVFLGYRCECGGKLMNWGDDRLDCEKCSKKYYY